MSGMPLFQALFLLASAVIIVAVTQSRRLHPFLAITIVATAFGLAAGFSTAFVGKTFGIGFSQAMLGPGLVIVAAGFVSALAESSGASDRLAAAVGRWRFPGSATIAALLGLIAGVGASPAAAFALLTPLLRPLGGGTARQGETTATTLALGISAGHGLLLLAPVPIAAASILDASWSRVALFGVPISLLVVACGAVWARWLPAAGTAAPPPMTEQATSAEPRDGGLAAVLVLAATVPLLMLMVQSLGDIPSEPLGGGPRREMVLAFGRPLFLLLVAVGIMVVGHARLSGKLFADAGWTQRVLGQVAGIVLVVGAAGGLQKLCQETGMAELLGERLLAWHAGLLVPFLIAAVIKTLQGSSLVAAITAAGMMQTALLPLGLDNDGGKALATLAIGAGAMTFSHVNDEFFWLVTASAGWRPSRAVAAITGGTLVQGLMALGALLLLSLFVFVG
jgi:GntP family gluconate:H+ symporter